MRRYEYRDSHEISFKEWLILSAIIFILGLVIAMMIHRVNAAPVPLPKEVKKLTDKDIVGIYSAEYNTIKFNFTLWPDKVFNAVFNNKYWQGTWKYQDPYIIVEEWEIDSESYGQPDRALVWYISVSRDKKGNIVRFNYICMVGKPDIKKDK